jgi:clostripain
MSDSNDTIEVTRRRQGASSGPSGRADAPARRRDSGSGGAGGGGTGGDGSGGRPTGSGGGAGGGGSNIRLPWWAVALLVIGYLIYSIFFAGDENSSQTPATQSADQSSQEVAAGETTVPPTPTPVRRKTVTSSSATSKNQAKAWTVMLYEDADDQILEEDMYMDLNEMERAGSTDQVNIVAQMDRFKGAYKGDGNWSTTRRYLIRQDDDLKKVNSDMLDDLGEANMSDGATLVDFVTWAMKTYPAEHYALVLSDHGMGWPGGWSDGDSGGSTSSKIPLVSQLDDNLYLMELGGALQDIQSQTGVKKLDLIGMDACLMSHLEVYAALAPYANYAVASQETEPALGWAYTSFLSGLDDNPGMDGAALGKLIVQGYIRDDQRIVDDQARADFTRSTRGSVPDASQVAKEMSSDVTLTAVDLQALPTLMKSVNDLVNALQDEEQSTVSDAREYAQSFTNIFGKGHSPYIDLGNFMQMLQRSGFSKKVSAAASSVLAAEKQAIVAEKHGPDRKGATGISIYFPNSTLYRSPISGAQSYTGIAATFAKSSLWDDFLAYHYNDVPIKADSNQAAVPGSSAPKRAPGAGKIEVSPITLSAKTAAQDKPVTMSAKIKGQNIGYIYLFVGYKDTASNSIFVIDQDYLQSPDTREQGGIFYPVWKQNETFNMKLKWEPTVFSVSNGQESEAVALTPLTYGADPTEAEYTLDGVYTYSQDNQTRPARLILRNGTVQRVLGFNGQPGNDSAGAPAEILPQPGDTFTIQETWFDVDANGQFSQVSTQDGKTLTFGDQPFTWQEQYAAAGEYVIGFIVQDLDGNTVESYTNVTVK